MDRIVCVPSLGSSGTKEYESKLGGSQRGCLRSISLDREESNLGSLCGSDRLN